MSSIVRNGTSSVFLDGEDGDDVRVVERGERLGFPSEARQTVTISREGIGKHLERNITIEFRVARAIDLTHPTCAEHRLYAIGTERAAGG